MEIEIGEKDEDEQSHERDENEVGETENVDKSTDDEEMMCVSEWQCEDDGYEAEDEQDGAIMKTNVSSNVQGQESNCKEIVEDQADLGSGERHAKQTSKVDKSKHTSVQLSSIREKRDLMDFLQMGRKHNVWKEIKATKAEIKKLEKEVKETRKPEDRSQ